MGLSAGYAQAVITPDLSKEIFLAGFDQNRTAVGIHDGLWVRATALKSGKTACKVLISVDLIGLGFLTCQRIREKINAEVPKAAVLISSTHTHHAPDTLGLWGSDWQNSGVDPDYLDFVIDIAADTALLALEQLSPVRLRTAAVKVNGVVKNVRDPEIMENELIGLQFQKMDGTTLVSWVNFACHPETLWKDNRWITSDYPHFLRLAVEEKLGGEAVFFPGSLGGMQTPDVEEHCFDEAERIGRTLASAVETALNEAAWQEDPILTLVTEDMHVPVSNPVLEGALRSGLVSGAWFKDGEVLTRTSLLRIGSLVLAAVPGEVLPKLGLWIKQELKKEDPTQISGVLGLTDDELGYILPEEDYLFPEDPFYPGSHYEETMSVGPKAGSVLKAAVQTLLAVLSKEQR